MQSIILDNNKYHLRSSKITDQQKKLYWVWGKIDFLSIFTKNSGRWQLQNVCLINKARMFDFVEVCSHGAMFEETKWSDGNDDIYIELPINFANLKNEISSRFNEIND